MPITTAPADAIRDAATSSASDHPPAAPKKKTMPRGVPAASNKRASPKRPASTGVEIGPQALSAVARRNTATTDVRRFCGWILASDLQALSDFGPPP